MVNVDGRVSRESPIVLLVDDDEDSAAMYAIGLSAMGFQPVTAGTAEDGFSAPVASSLTSSLRT